MLPINKSDTIAAIVAVSSYADDQFIITLTEKGLVKKTALSQYENIRSNGINAIKLVVNPPSGRGGLPVSHLSVCTRHLNIYHIAFESSSRNSSMETLEDLHNVTRKSIVKAVSERQTSRLAKHVCLICWDSGRRPGHGGGAKQARRQPPRGDVVGLRVTVSLERSRHTGQSVSGAEGAYGMVFQFVALEHVSDILRAYFQQICRRLSVLYYCARPHALHLC